MKNSMAIVCPNYLCHNTLPRVSDVFFHENIMYFMPVGINPLEWTNVLGFPEYCMSKSIDMPIIIWEMINHYFQCSKEAIDCNDILSPLGKRILKVSTIYPRNTEAIMASRKKVQLNPRLLDSFIDSTNDFKFLSRELMSHILYEVYLEGGFKLVIKYIDDNCSNEKNFYELLASVITNRMKLFTSDNNLLVYNNEWYPYLKEYFSSHIINKKQIEASQDDIDILQFNFFSYILYPIFGKCDTIKKSETVNKLMKDDWDAIQEFKKKCRDIVIECVLNQNNKYDFREEKMKQLIEKEILDPLSQMMHKPKENAKKVLNDFILDSTVIGGVLGISQGLDYQSLGIATAAGTISAGLKYIINEATTKRIEPTKILLDGLKKNHVKYLDYEKKLKGMSINELL